MMPTIYDLKTPLDLVLLLVWTLPIWTVSCAVFESPLARRLLARLWPPALQSHISRLRWELHYGVDAFDRPTVHMGKPMPRRALSQDEMQDRNRELMAIWKAMRWRLRLTKLLSCRLCQGWWSSLLFVCALSWRSGPAAVVITALACACPVTLLRGLSARMLGHRGSQPSSGCGCGKKAPKNAIRSPGEGRSKG